MFFILKGTDKKNKVSSDSDTVKQESLSQELPETNNTIISTNDKEKRHQTRGPTTVKKNPLNKDLPPNHNVTQSNNKKSSRMLTDLIKLPTYTKLSENKTVLNSRNGKPSLFNVTFTENVKKPSQNNDMKVLKGVVSMTQKMKNANATEELKGGDKKRNLNATTSTKTEKNSTKQSVILLKEGSSEMKTEKHSDEKDKKLNKGNVTPLNKVSLGKIKVEKHLNVNNATEKDRKSQSNATPLEEKTSGEGNVTTSSEKWKKVATGDETKNVKFTQGNKSKTGLQHGNITASTEKDNKLHQGNATHTKDGSSRKTKKDSHLNGTMSLEKDKALSQNNGEKKLGKKVDKVNEKKSNEKGKKFLQGDEMTVIKILSVAEEGVNVSVTTTSEKDKSLQHSLKEDASSKSKVNSDLKNITISKTHVERTTKPTDVGPVAVHNITATGFVITWEASQGVFRNFTVTKKEVWSGRSSEDDAEEAEKSPNGDLKADKFISSNKTSSNVYTGKAERKSAEKFSQILAGSARSYHFKNLRPQRKYLVSLFGSGPHVRSKVHSLYVSTGK